jgi:hypothetical protein
VGDQVTHPLKQEHKCLAFQLIKQLKLKRTSSFIALSLSCSLFGPIVVTWQVWVITGSTVGLQRNTNGLFCSPFLQPTNIHHCRLNLTQLNGYAVLICASLKIKFYFCLRNDKALPNMQGGREGLY